MEVQVRLFAAHRGPPSTPIPRTAVLRRDWLNPPATISKFDAIAGACAAAVGANGRFRFMQVAVISAVADASGDWSGIEPLWDNDRNMVGTKAAVWVALRQWWTNGARGIIALVPPHCEQTGTPQRLALLCGRLFVAKLRCYEPGLAKRVEDLVVAQCDPRPLAARMRDRAYNLHRAITERHRGNHQAELDVVLKHLEMLWYECDCPEAAVTLGRIFCAEVLAPGRSCNKNVILASEGLLRSAATHDRRQVDAKEGIIISMMVLAGPTVDCWRERAYWNRFL